MAPLVLTLIFSMLYTVAPMSHFDNSTQSQYVIVEDNFEAESDMTEDTSENSAETSCEDVMARNGLNFSSFWQGAAHGIHSLYLEEIREYFEPNATIHNRIPVVNQNLSSDEIILFDTPLAGFDEDFKTMAMKLMAYFMLNDNPDFVTQGTNTLEKVTHQYHMNEIYAAAAPLYRSMKKNPPKDVDLCPCVNDIAGNGILEGLTSVARQLKNFNNKRQPRASKFKYKYVDDCGNKYKIVIGCGGSRRRAAEKDTMTPEIIAQYESEYLANSTQENAERLIEAKPWEPNTLEGPKQWVSYEAMLTDAMLDEEQLNDFAVFMYCKLNQPDLYHPRGLFD